MFAELNHDGTLRVQKRRRKPSSNERTGSVVDAAKQFLEEVKMEEKVERPMGGDDEMEKSSDQHTAVSAVLESIKDEVTEHTVADIKIAQQLDSNKGSVTCNEIVEHKQNDPNEGSVTSNEIAEDKPSNPNEGSVTYNEANANPADGTACNEELTKEHVKSENWRDREKSEQPPADFLSGTVEYSLIVVMINLLL